MSLGSKRVPLIEVTPEAEEDDDSNILSLALDALTDLEELEMEEGDEAKCKRKKKTKPKLMLKIRRDDATLTDVEDMQDSEDGDVPVELIRHARPVSTEAADPRIGEREEVVDARDGKKKFSSRVESIRGNAVDAKGEKSILTDYEDLDASDGDGSLDVPDANLPRGLLEENGHVSVRERFRSKGAKSPPVTPNCSDDEAVRRGARGKRANRLEVDQEEICNVTDVEVVGPEDSEEKSRKARRRRPREKRPPTDVEDLDVSGEESAPGSKIAGEDVQSRKGVRRRQPFLQYSLYESDDEEEEPQRRARGAKASRVLKKKRAPDDTDTEDFEADQNLSDAEYSTFSFDRPKLEESKMEAVIEMLSDCCSVVRDTSKVQKKNLAETYRIEQRGKEEEKVDEEETDFDNYQTETEHPPEYRVRVPSNLDLEVRFSSSLKADVRGEPTKRSRIDGEVYTEVESLNSSQEERRSPGDIPVAVIKKLGGETDEEDVSGDEGDASRPWPEFRLPEAPREKIHIKEDENGAPLVKIMPLGGDEVGPGLGLGLGLALEGLPTDVESLSDGEVPGEGGEDHGGSPQGDFPRYEGGRVEEKEFFKGAKENPPGIAEDNTDTEEVALGRDGSEGDVEFKKEKYLTVPERRKRRGRCEKGQRDRGAKASGRLPSEDCSTDVENLEASEGEEGEGVRSSSCTPRHLRELENETVRAKEGHVMARERFGRGSTAPRRGGLLASPAVTDTEDVSVEEDLTYSRAETSTPDAKGNGDVLHLKGGSHLDEDFEDLEDVGGDSSVEIARFDPDDRRVAYGKCAEGKKKQNSEIREGIFFYFFVNQVRRDTPRVTCFDP